MSKKKKPCPFCGGTNLYIWEGALNLLPFYVLCLDCRGEGGKSDDFDEAIDKWNKRAKVD